MTPPRQSMASTLVMGAPQERGVEPSKLLGASKSQVRKSQKEQTHSAISLSSRARTSVDRNNNQVLAMKLLGEQPPSKRIKAAVKFKYQANASEEDLCEMRRLLALERHEQSLQARGNKASLRAKLDFYYSDYERMMADDWLVTRFLLRGQKAAERSGRRLQSASTSGDSDGDSATGEEDFDARGDICQTRRAIYSSTMELIKICAKFRYDYQINSTTREAEFPPEWVKMHGLFHYEPDRAGNPTVYLRVALHRPKLIESPEARHEFKRYMLYTLERCDQQLFNEPGKAICCVFDMTNVAFENIDLELTAWMIKSFKSCSPKLLCYVLVYNPPWFFAATFKLICNTLLSESKRQSIKFAHGSEIMDFIARENLPEYIGSSLT